MPQLPSKRLTLSDLSVALVVSLFLVSPLPRVAQRSREQANRVKCASNLRQIGQAIRMYANSNGGAFPRTASDESVSLPVAYSNPLVPDPFGVGGPGPNDITSALFLLIRTQGVSSEVFLCPSGPSVTPWNYQRRQVTQVSNFPGRRYLHYSYANPYATPPAMAAGFKLDAALPPDFAIAADMNPGGDSVVSAAPQSPRAVMQTANSRNHNGDGQNVLYADGHVEFQNTPFCSVLRPDTSGGNNSFRDNIYTCGAGWGGGVGIRGSPVDALDSVLLPTALDGPTSGVGAPPATLLRRGIVAAVVGIGLLLLAVALLYRKPAAAPPSIR